MNVTDINWTDLLGRSADELDPKTVDEYIRGKRVLITGAGGSIGSPLARMLAAAGVERLVALDIGEHGLFELDASLNEEAGSTKAELVVGNVCDKALLREVFATHRPELVIHAAACKHVALMEANPFAAARSNILGTHRLLRAANQSGAEQVIVLSTDKAVDPVGIMGATKRAAELLVMASSGATRCKAMRLANVLGSSGSVVPTFLRQIARGGPLTITDEGCTRYFLTMDEAVSHLVSALAVDAASTVLVPEMGQPIPIVELARFLMKQVGHAKSDIQIAHTGLRAGEKLTEEMVAADESIKTGTVPWLQSVVSSGAISASTVDLSVAEIETAIERRDLRRLLLAITALVPAYQPSLQIQQRAGCISQNQSTQNTDILGES